jgi:uncharacterized protein (TIGR02996 family)
MASTYSSPFPKDLLARVLEAPDDDGPRLAIADRLKDARSALIKLQCALAANAALAPDEQMPTDERVALEENAHALLQTHGARWQYEEGLGNTPTCSVRFERGFIEEVEVSTNFAEIGNGWDLSPIRHVRLRRSDLFAELLALPLAQRIHSLTLASHTNPAGPQLARLSNLERFSCRAAELGPAELQIIGMWPSLRGLCLTDSGVGPLLPTLVKPAFTRNIVELTLTSEHDEGGPIPQVAWAIATARWNALQHLTLFGLGISDEDAKTLATSKYMRNLVSLDLSNNEIGADGALALARSPVLTKLQLLDLSLNRNITSTAAADFANAQCLPALRYLELSYVGGLSPEAHASLRARFGDGVTMRV